MSEVHLFTDGACSGNPGPGGWAFILRHPASGKELEQSGGEEVTTNNRMELTAAVRGLEALNRQDAGRAVHRQRLRRQGDQRMAAEMEGERLAAEGSEQVGRDCQRGAMARAG